MEPIKLQGVQIYDHYRMKKSSNLRIVLELTEEDSKRYAGVLAIAEMNEVTLNAELQLSEIQGNNNGHEQEAEKLANPSISEQKQPSSTYQEFRLKCIEYSGEAYYEKVKNMLGVEHLRDLEKTLNLVDIVIALQTQMDFLDARMKKYPVSPTVYSINPIWHKLFDPINNQ